MILQGPADLLVIGDVYYEPMRKWLDREMSHPGVVELGLNTNHVSLFFVLGAEHVELRWV